MSTSNGSLKFTMTSRALKLLGQNLYARPWSAVSELVANGIDAGATTIYVSMTEDPATNTGTLEVLDNGSGMSEEDLEHYVSIGFDKRATTSSFNRNRAPMGRKGIGKLAALYLSNEYYIHTKTIKTTGGQFNSAWHMQLDLTTDADKEPSLNQIDHSAIPSIHLAEKFDEQDSGTLITIPNIELKGLGTQAFKSLASRLAIHFLKDVLPDLHIHFSHQQVGELTRFTEVEWNPAYGNFLLLSTTESHVDIQDKTNPTVIIQSASRKDTTIVETKVTPVPDFPEDDFLESNIADRISPSPERNRISGTYFSNQQQRQSFPYDLKGWLALHATIKTKIAKNNDERFEKNKFFSPTQIRLYVRGKLALEDLRPYLNLTEQYANYLEGELQFDLLDEDDLPDIATTSRESFDTEDPRFTTLCILVRNWAQKIINQRSKIAQDEKLRLAEATAKANNIYAQRISQSIDKLNIPDGTAADLKQEVHLGLTREDPLAKNGQIEAKGEYRVFISHSRKNSEIANIIYHMLLELGAQPEEIFYSSRDKETTDETKQIKQLQEQIHETITNAATKICYITSKGFCSSVYCCFEGGAGWATRAVSDYELITTTYKHKPDWLNIGLQTESIIDSNGTFPLNRTTYLLFAETVNRLVEHLNLGRSIKQEQPIHRILEINIPSDYELRRRGQEIFEFFNKTLAEMITHAGTEDYSGEVIDEKCSADENCPLKPK